MSARTRKAILVVHVASAGAWLGIDVVMAILIFTSLGTSDVHTRAVCYEALSLFAVWPLLSVGLLSLASGILLGLGTRYGLVRYWWVVAKLALNVLLSALVLIGLRPGIAELNRLGHELDAGTTTIAPIGNMIFPPIVSPICLAIAFVLAVFKPWGRIRRRRRPDTATADAIPIRYRTARRPSTSASADGGTR